MRLQTMVQISWVICLLLGLPGVSFGGGGESAQIVEFSRLAKMGEPLFQFYCAHCHGAQGDGDGYNAENLDKDPAELSNLDFVSKKSNEKLFKVISKGGAAVKKSYLMPVFGHTLSEEEIWSLVAYIRLLAKDMKHAVDLPEGAKTDRPRHPDATPETLAAFKKWFQKEGASGESIKAGRRLFKDKLACFGCHNVEDEGGQVGPDLTRAGDLYKPEWLYYWIRNPQHAKPEIKMPNLGVSEEQTRLLVAFLESMEAEEEIVLEAWQKILAEGGDPEAGKQLFFDSEGIANCAKCHSVNGQGGHIGPDLSFVGISRKKEFLLESILNPKAVITVGYSSILILMKDGKFLTGIKINEDDESLDIVDKEGQSLHVDKSNVKKFKTQRISMMPGNFGEILSEKEIRDLLAYLSSLTLPDFTQ